MVFLLFFIFFCSWGENGRDASPLRWGRLRRLGGLVYTRYQFLFAARRKRQSIFDELLFPT